MNAPSTIPVPVAADWIDKHRVAWSRKSGLRRFYQSAVYDRVLRSLASGPSLEIGSGGMFFAGYAGERGLSDLICTDVTSQQGVQVTADVHALPFKDESFANVIAIHVLHHFGNPLVALREVARMLRPGGRAHFIEPWTGALGRLFYKYVHHEDYEPIPNPWLYEQRATKRAMDGNVAVGQALFVDRAEELVLQVPSLELSRVEWFGCLSYLLTGGFQPRIGAPAAVIALFQGAEDLLPQTFMKHIGIQALYELRKKT